MCVLLLLVYYDPMSNSVVAAWNVSRYVMIAYLCVFTALYAGFSLYIGAVQYDDTYNANCRAPGTLTSDIWSWDFVIQGFYGLFLVPYIVFGFIMIIFWWTRVPYFVFVVLTLLLMGYFLGTGIYLSLQAARANTCEAVGNPFNDLRICGVCGGFSAWTSSCYILQPYNPPVIDGLIINTAKSFQLAFHWVFFVMLIMAMFYVPTYYLRSQNAYIEALSAPTQDVVEEEENDGYGTTPTKTLDLPLLHARRKLLVRK